MAAILAIHAHPDDIETLAAGTLALLAECGHRIVIATATAGEGGATETSPEETARIRIAEAAAAAALIGAEYRCAGLPDLGVFNDDAGRRRITEVVRRRPASSLKTPRSGRPAQRYSAPISAAAAAASAMRMRAVSSGEVSVAPPSPAVAVAMTIRWPHSASSASV